MNSKIIKNLFKGTLATTSGTIATMGFHFLSIYFLARYLSQTEFGYYALIFTISNLLNLLSNLGLEISIVKNIAEGSPQRNSVLKPTLILKSLFSVFILLIYSIFYKFYPTDGFEGLWDFNTFIIILGSFRDLFYRVLQGLNQFKHYSLIQISTASLRVILIISSIYTGHFNFHILLYFEIAVISLSLVLQLIVIPFKDLVKENISITEYRNLLKFSSPLYANNLITFTYDRIGVFIIGLFMTAASVAVYDVSTKIPSALQGILSSYVLVFFPNISTLFSTGDYKSAEKLINKSVSFISFLLNIMIIIIALWNKEFINFFFSEKYIESALPLIIMMFSLLLRNLSNILGYSIVAAGYSKIPMKVNLTSVIVGIISSVILVKLWSYNGAALATLIMNLITLIQYSYHHKKLNLIRVDFAYVNTILLTLIIALGSVMIFNQYLIIKLIALLLFLLINYKYFSEILNFYTQLKSLKSADVKG
jgi:O-antigen/teichoic acid export membrane protein